MDQRVEERHADEVERKKYLEERLMSQIGSATEAELTNKPDWNGSETPLVAEFDLKIPGWASSAGQPRGSSRRDFYCQRARGL